MSIKYQIYCWRASEQTELQKSNFFWFGFTWFLELFFARLEPQVQHCTVCGELPSKLDTIHMEVSGIVRKGPTKCYLSTKQKQQGQLK